MGLYSLLAKSDAQPCEIVIGGKTSFCFPLFR